LAVAREESVPTYQYACTECGGQIEALQKFSDDPLTVHEACGGKLRKVFSPVGIVFKGSGFYRTDSRSDSGSSASSASGSAASDAGSASSSETSSSAGGDKGSGDKASGDKGSGDKAAKSAPASSGSAAKAGAASKSSEKVA
jgi:putative FmdB family regulatory protein